MTTGEIVFRMCEKVSMDEAGICTNYNSKDHANPLIYVTLPVVKNIMSMSFIGTRCVENHAPLLMIDLQKLFCLIIIASLGIFI